jgi:hypothetical protein
VPFCSPGRVLRIPQVLPRHHQESAHARPWSGGRHWPAYESGRGPIRDRNLGGVVSQDGRAQEPWRGRRRAARKARLPPSRSMRGSRSWATGGGEATSSVSRRGDLHRRDLGTAQPSSVWMCPASFRGRSDDRTGVHHRPGGRRGGRLRASTDPRTPRRRQAAIDLRREGLDRKVQCSWRVRRARAGSRARRRRPRGHPRRRSRARSHPDVGPDLPPPRSWKCPPSPGSTEVGRSFRSGYPR